MLSESLPAGWTELSFGDMATHISERVDDPRTAGVEIYVGLEHLDPGDLRIRRRGVPGDVEAQKLRVRPGQIIFGKRRAYQRKVAVADFGICSAHAMILEAKPVLAPAFLPFFMQSDAFMDRAVTVSEGGLSPTIKWKTLAAEKFLLPPLEQQHELVELMQGFEAAIEAGVETLEAARRLRLTLGTGMLSAEPGTASAQLDQVADVVGGKQLSPAFATGDNMLPYLRAGNIRPGWIDFSEVFQMNFEPREEERLTVRPGDTLLMEGNANPDYVGTPVLYTSDMPTNHCIQNTVVRVRSKDNTVLSPDYLYMLMRHQFEVGKFKELASGSSIKHLGSTRLARISVNLPALAEQQRIVVLLSATAEAVDQCSTELTHLQNLRSSVLNSILTPSTSTPALVTA